MVAAWSEVEASGTPRGSTVGMSLSYLAPAVSEDLSATAHVLRRGRSIVYLDVDVQTASGALVAKGLVTYKIG
jgi:acyl-coenzyme A thioesterase PaaI-like protein